MKIKEFRVEYYPPALIIVLADKSEEFELEYLVPAANNTPKAIYQFLIVENDLLPNYAKELKAFAKILFAAQQSAIKYRPELVTEPHFACVSQICYSKLNNVFVTISADCSACFIAGAQRKTLELPARPSYLLLADSRVLIGMFSLQVLVYDYEEQFCQRYELNSVPIHMYQIDSAQFLVSLFDGRCILLNIESSEILLIYEHSGPAIYAFNLSAHKYFTCGYDGRCVLKDVRKLESRLSSKARSGLEQQESAITAIEYEEKLLIIGYANGFVEILRYECDEFEAIFEQQYEKAITACDISIDGGVVAFAHLGKFYVHDVMAGQTKEYTIGGEIKELGILHPREAVKVLILSDKLIYMNISKKQKQQFQCGKTGFMQQSYDSKTVLVGTQEGEIWQYNSE